jgi:predicted DNA-binding protein YlxM (UPF0122 family)
MGDCSAKGRIKLPGLVGDDHPNTSLTEDQVRAIRADTRSLRKIATEYGISKSSVHDLKARKTWGHLQ